MIRLSIGEIETTEPAVGEVEVPLLAQTPFRADAGQIAEQQHQFRID